MPQSLLSVNCSQCIATAGEKLNFNKKHSNNLTKTNKENIINKNIERRNEINTNCKKNNINKKSCMLILNKYPKQMQPKYAKTKQNKTKYEIEIHESKGRKPRN